MRLLDVLCVQDDFELLCLICSSVSELQESSSNDAAGLGITLTRAISPHIARSGITCDAAVKQVVHRVCSKTGCSATPSLLAWHGGQTLHAAPYGFATTQCQHLLQRCTYVRSCQNHTCLYLVCCALFLSQLRCLGMVSITKLQCRKQHTA